MAASHPFLGELFLRSKLEFLGNQLGHPFVITKVSLKRRNQQDTIPMTSYMSLSIPYKDPFFTGKRDTVGKYSP